MNAAEQVTDFQLASKIAAVVNLFRSKFPDAKADMKPWANDPDTREWMDPDSIDIGFHLPGWSPRFQSRSILVQIRFYLDPLEASHRAIGIDVAGFTHQGEQWRFSTVGNWEFEGRAQPKEAIADQLREFCRQSFDLFNAETPA